MKVNRPVVGPRVFTNEVSWFISYRKPESRVKKERSLIRDVDSVSVCNEGEDRDTYGDLDENAHSRILLIVLFPLVPFKRTILPWFAPSQQ